MREIPAGIWAACGGPTARAPHVHSLVYYFPEGHFESSSSPPLSSPCLNLSRPFFLCSISSVRLLADPSSDEIYSLITLSPSNALHSSTSPPRKTLLPESFSFSKVLTQSDANNGGGFSVPRSCAESVFPPLDLTADPPVQNLMMRDLHGRVFEFRHIYRGTPRRHLLTTGWARFVNEKKLVAGDTVVFIKNGCELYIGVRRGPRFQRGHVAAEDVLSSIESAANDRSFEVAYYPRVGDGSAEFVVEKERVERAMMAGYWSVGLRVKMGVESVDSVRTSVYQGTVSEIRSKPPPWTASPWRALHITWDDPEALKLVRQVSPWQVEINQPIPQILHYSSPPPLKKSRTNSNDPFTPCIQGARHQSAVHPVHHTPPDLEGSTELSRSSSQGKNGVTGTLMLFGKLIEFVHSDDSEEGFNKDTGDEIFLPGFEESKVDSSTHTRFFTDLVLQRGV